MNGWERFARRWPGAAAAVLGLMLASCGDKTQGPQPVSDLTGPWNLYATWSGSQVEDQPLHVTITQSGAALTMIATCVPDMPVAHGTRTGNNMSLDWIIPGEGTYHIAGTISTSGATGTISGFRAGTWRLVASYPLDCGQACAALAVSAFVSHDFTDLAKVSEISLFRSAAGHSFTDDCESCRSMKHYFAPYQAYRANSTIEIFSPVDGVVTGIYAEGYGDSGAAVNKQVHIRSTAHPEYTFRLFHVDLLSGQIVVGKPVTAGEQVGWARMFQVSVGQMSHDFDIAVEVGTPFGDRMVSFFETMTDGLFSQYVARGAASRTTFVLSKASRDADPLSCSGEAFTSTGNLPAWFTLTPGHP